MSAKYGSLTGRLKMEIAGNQIDLGSVQVPLVGYYDRGSVQVQLDVNDVAGTVAVAVNALPDLLDALEKAETAIERVRELHAPTDVDVLPPDCTAEDCEHEDECPTVERKVCKACYDLGESIDVYGYERGGIEHVFYPCPTIQALNGGGRDE